MGRIERNLPNNAYQAAVNANAPGPINTYATLADVLVGSGGNRIITGNAAYSGVGLIYDVTALTYIIQGTLYASAATQVTLTAADPTLGRIDVILVDDLGVVSVLTGIPSATPVKSQVDAASQVEVTFVIVPAGATFPVIVIETVYAEDLGTGGGEWAATTNGTVNLASTNDPHTGAVSIEVNGSFGPNKNILFAPGAPYTIVGGQLIFWLNAKSTMVPSYNAMQIGLFDGGVLQGNLVTVGGTNSITFGFDSSIVGTYQLVTIPLIAFGGVATIIDTIAFIKGGGATTLDFFLDDVDIQEGVPTPPAAVINFDDLGDVTLDFDTSVGVQDDDGKVPYYDTSLQKFITSEEVNMGTVVIDAKKFFPGTIAKGLPVYIHGYDSDIHQVELAAAGDLNKTPVIGFTAEILNTTDSKHVVTFGKLRGLNTTNAVTTLNPNGETWAVNDVLYLSIFPGGLTSVRPTGAATAIQRVAKILRVDVNGGQIFIFNTARTAGLPNLGAGKIWTGDANNHPVEVDIPGGGGGSAKFNHTTYAYDYVVASGTWQGVNVSGVGTTEWNDRWRVATFSGVGGADGFYINFRLSESYTSGADLKVSLDFSSLIGAGGGTAAIRVGLTQPLPGGPFGIEGTTAYAAQDLPIAAGDSISTFIAQFSGVTINPGDQIAILVFRDPGAPGDTINDFIYNSTIQIEEV
jgi:hypothetical protein